MRIDEQDIRERLTAIVADVQYTPDTARLLAAGQQLRRRRKRVAAVSAGVLFVLVVSIGLSVLITVSGRRATPPALHRKGTLAPLADVSATPAGWSPVAYQSGQISVPSGWFIENLGMECGQHDAGRVFIDESTRLDPTLCGRADNVVTIRPAGFRAIPHHHPATVNDVTVELGWSAHSNHVTFLARALGLDITATGPLAQRVLGTITHSPLSVVLNSTGLSAPTRWQHVSFGGLHLAVPQRWLMQRVSSWGGGCGYGLTGELLLLSSAQTLSVVSCPAPSSTAAFEAGSSGMVVGAGPHIDEPARGATCLERNRLRICIDSPPIRNGHPTDRRLNVLTAHVYLPDGHPPIEIQIGLGGSGLTAALIFGSLKASS